MGVAAETDNVWDLGPPPSRPGPAPAADHVPSGVAVSLPPPTVLPVPEAPSGVPPAARRVFDELLNPPPRRPVAPPDVADRLREVLAPFASTVAGVWPESTLRLSKSALVGVGRCEGLSVASRLRGFPDRMPVPVAVGQVVHRAVQMLWTHPGHPLPEYVRAAVSGCGDDSPDFAAFWAQASMAVQSDVLAKASARLAEFADAFPPLRDEWAPRFEQQVSARVGALAVVGRPDVMLGRPRTGGVRTMLVCDVKSGELGEEHRFEALLYALLLTLRHGVPPWRSTVFSLASGEWTDPDFTVEDLLGVAVRVGEAAVAVAQLWAEVREPVLTPGGFCRWCPAAAACPSAERSGR